MKKITIFALVLVLACSLAACGCQMSTEPDNGNTTVNTAPTTTEPLIDPTILDPTFETNIPDSTVNDNSTNDGNTRGGIHGGMNGAGY